MKKIQLEKTLIKFYQQLNTEFDLDGKTFTVDHLLNKLDKIERIYANFENPAAYKLEFEWSAADIPLEWFYNHVCKVYQTIQWAAKGDI